MRLLLKLGYAIASHRYRLNRFRVFEALPWGHPDKLDSLESLLATFPADDAAWIRAELVKRWSR